MTGYDRFTVNGGLDTAHFIGNGERAPGVHEAGIGQPTSLFLEERGTEDTASHQGSVHMLTHGYHSPSGFLGGRERQRRFAAENSERILSFRSS